MPINSRLHSPGGRALLLALLLGFPRPPVVLDQREHSFRYFSAVGSSIHTISRSNIFMSAVRGDGTDSVIAESERLEGLTSWVDASNNGRFSTLLVYDSVRVRTRLPGGRWRDIAPTERETAVSRVVLTDRREALGSEFVDVPHLRASVAEVMRGAGAGVHLELPENPVSVGEIWRADLAYPLTLLSGLERDYGVSVSGGLETSATVRLDSIVDRSSDTLAFFTVIGRIKPKAGDDFVVTGGVLAATLVWSSGWRTFASAATRAVIYMQPRRRQGDVSNTIKMRFEITTQTRVRL